jgi:hypothetical protein
MIPAEFSIRGPHNTVPHLVIVFYTDRRSEAAMRATMLIWAEDEATVRRYVSGHYKVDDGAVQVFPAPRNHHLGLKRVVFNVQEPCE